MPGQFRSFQGWRSEAIRFCPTRSLSYSQYGVTIRILTTQTRIRMIPDKSVQEQSKASLSNDNLRITILTVTQNIIKVKQTVVTHNLCNIKAGILNCKY